VVRAWLTTKGGCVRLHPEFRTRRGKNYGTSKKGEEKEAVSAVNPF
jgi:hypothetical protein